MWNTCLSLQTFSIPLSKKPRTFWYCVTNCLFSRTLTLSPGLKLWICCKFEKKKRLLNWTGWSRNRLSHVRFSLRSDTVLAFHLISVKLTVSFATCLFPTQQGFFSNITYISSFLFHFILLGRICHDGQFKNRIAWLIATSFIQFSNSLKSLHFDKIPIDYVLHSFTVSRYPVETALIEKFSAQKATGPDDLLN